MFVEAVDIARDIHSSLSKINQLYEIRSEVCTTFELVDYLRAMSVPYTLPSLQASEICTLERVDTSMRARFTTIGMCKQARDPLMMPWLRRRVCEVQLLGLRDAVRVRFYPHQMC